MVSKSPPNSLPVLGRAAGALEGVASKRWRQLERFAQAIRSLGDKPMTRASAERLDKRSGVHWATVYRDRARLREVDKATAIAGRNRRWKPLASRVSAKQELGIEESINVLRKKPGPIRVVDLVEEVGTRCRLHRVPCPSRPAIDRRLNGSAGLKAHRRGIAAPGNAAAMRFEICREVQHRLVVSALGGEQQPLGVQVVHDGDVMLATAQAGLVDAHDLYAVEALLDTRLIANAEASKAPSAAHIPLERAGATEIRRSRRRGAPVQDWYRSTGGRQSRVLRAPLGHWPGLPSVEGAVEA